MDKIRLIVSDMDGTLLNEKQELSSDTIKILIQAQQQGIGVVLASGRGLKDLISYGKQLELDQYPLSGYITLNGLELYDSKRKCIEKQQRLTYADIITFNKISLKYQIPLIIFFEDTSYLLNSTSINKSYLVDTSWVENSNMDLIKKQDETKLLKIVLCGNEESIEYMLNHLDENIFNQYEISKVEKQWVEINPKGINKGYGLLKYLNQYHLAKNEVVVFGNGENDISMLKQTPNSVVVENALDGVKGYATYLCKNNNEDGVVKFIKEKIL